jgi:hypothetical protein
MSVLTFMSVIFRCKSLLARSLAAFEGSRK